MAIKAVDLKAKRDREFYNLLPHEREVIRKAQGNKDPITGEPLSEHAHLDHDHKNGLVRGLLNPMTNKTLIDKLDILRKSIEYLEHPPAVRAIGTVYGLIGKAKKKKKMLYGPDGSPEPQPRVMPAVDFETVRRGD